MKNIDFLFIALAVGLSSFASCTKAIDAEREKTIQLKLQLEHESKNK